MAFKEQFETIGEGLLVRAPAKINLSLLIAGKRPDGFHEIESIMAKVDLFDELFIEHTRKPGIEILCKGPCWAPPGKENLIHKACRMLLEGRRSQPHIRITLTKNIPAGAGLGSASSDAAAALLGVKRFLKLDVPQRSLAKWASGVGSDVPFFLDGPLALCTGKGEKIKKLNENFNFWALLILPDVSVSTKKVYANYQHDPALYQQLSGTISRYFQNNRIDLASKICANMLETTCFRMYKGLAELKAKSESLGIGPLCLTGSGAGMFLLLNSPHAQRARHYQHKLQQKVGCKSVIVSNNRW